MTHTQLVIVHMERDETESSEESFSNLVAVVSELKKKLETLATVTRVTLSVDAAAQEILEIIEGSRDDVLSEQPPTKRNPSDFAAQEPPPVPMEGQWAATSYGTPEQIKES